MEPTPSTTGLEIIVISKSLVTDAIVWQGLSSLKFRGRNPQTKHKQRLRPNYLYHLFGYLWFHRMFIKFVHLQTRRDRTLIRGDHECITCVSRGGGGSRVSLTCRAPSAASGQDLRLGNFAGKWPGKRACSGPMGRPCHVTAQCRWSRPLRRLLCSRTGPAGYLLFRVTLCTCPLCHRC